MKHLWQVHYHILSLIFLKKFKKSYLTMDVMIKDVKLAELNRNIPS